MRVFGSLVGVALFTCAGAARAEPAIVGVPGPDDRARVERIDPRGADVEVAADPGGECGRCDRPASSTVRAVRVSLGGAAAAMDRAGAHGVAGLDLGLELGSGVVGARLGAAWLRGDAQGPGLAQYGAEVVVDAIPRGAFHPIAALGIALAHSGGADAGVGTLRAGVAYSLPVREADLRLSLSILGALPGPTDPQASDLRGYVMGVGSLAIGF